MSKKERMTLRENKNSKKGLQNLCFINVNLDSIYNNYLVELIIIRNYNHLQGNVVFNSSVLRSDDEVFSM